MTEATGVDGADEELSMWSITAMSLLVLVCAAVAFADEAVRLAVDGRTDYQIVIADEAAPQVRADDDELASHPQ